MLPFFIAEKDSKKAADMRRLLENCLRVTGNDPAYFRKSADARLTVLHFSISNKKYHYKCEIYPF